MLAIVITEEGKKMLIEQLRNEEHFTKNKTFPSKFKKIFY